MASPLDQLTASLQQAISQALQDNASVFQQAAGNYPGNDDFAPGFDPLSILTNLLADAALAGILANIGGPLPAIINDAAEGGGKSFVEFILEFALGWIIPQLLQPFITDVQNQVNTIAKPGRFDVNQAADMANRGFYPVDSSAQDALETGFNDAHFAAAREAAHIWPQFDLINRLRNRGFIGDADVTVLMQRAGIPPAYQSAFEQLRNEILSPADLALAVLRGNITAAEGEQGAAEWGVSASDFNTLLLNTGEPPGLQQLDEAYRRGFIDKATLERGIRQSRVRNEWIPVIEALRYAPMSTAQAANAVVRGYLSQAEGQSIAEQNGLEPAHWQYVYESNGRPPSHLQLSELYYRGEIDRATFDQGIRESDIKDKYINDEFLLGVKLLPLFEGVSLLKNGDITGATFSKQMLDQGYQAEVINEIVSAIGGGTAHTQKHLTVTEITTMYEDGSIGHATASQKIQALGYTASDADAILNNSDVKAAAARTKTLIATVRSEFDRFQIDANTASGELAQIGVDSATITRLIHDWTIVRPPGGKRLTEPQIIRLFRKGFIQQTEAITRLQADGYTEADAQLLVSEYL